MTKTNKNVIWDFVNSSWYGQNMISHNDNLIVAKDILFSYNIPMAVYERGKFCPFRINYKLNKGKHKKHFNMLMDELLKINAKNIFMLIKGNLKVENNYWQQKDI